MKKEEKQSDKFQDAQHKENTSKSRSNEAENTAFPGYPLYPPSEDIYNQEKKVELNPDDLTKVKKDLEEPGDKNEKDFYEDMTGEDLDIPGSEADEAENNAGSEDEENNYYSLGGDNHNDLEEDNG